jgi:translation elongation factor EF-1beta
MMSKNKQDVKDNNVSSVVAGVTGAAIGFGIAAVGAAVVLNDKDNRKKVKNALTNIKDQAMSYVQDVQKKTDKKEKDIADKLASTKKVEVKLTS